MDLLTVTYSDGTSHNISPSPADFIKLERAYDVKVPQLNETNMSAEYLYFLAWSNLHRKGIEKDDFDTFLDKLSEVSEDSEDPKEPAS